MNINMIVNMVMRQLTRRAVNFGINKGIGTLANRGKTPESMTPEERASASKTTKSGKEAAKRARQALRITRRLGR